MTGNLGADIKLGCVKEFFFCGMIDEPVVKASVSVMKAELSSIIQMTISSARRDRWMAVMVAAASACTRSL